MKKLLILFICLAPLSFLLLLKERDSLYQITGKTMGTSYSVKFIGRFKKERIKKIKKDMKNILGDIDKKMSTYLPDSEISRFNKIKSTAPFPVSSKTAFVVGQALVIGKLSDNAFDITTGPLVNLWGFGASKGQKITPQKIKTLLYQSGQYRLIVDTKKNTLQKKIKNLKIDLSGIAKGYAVDVLVNYLKRQKIIHHLVEIGGELRASKKKDRDGYWRVGVVSPEEKKGEEMVLNLVDQAMATSGTYRNFYYKDQKKYTHIIDPKRGVPIAHNLLSVTVIADDCLTADAWATALMVLGEKKAMAVAQKNHLKAYFIVSDNYGLPHKTLSTTAFFSYYKKRRP